MVIVNPTLGQVNGLPSLEVVLADDGRPMGGTIVPYQVRARFPGVAPQILTQQPHVILDPERDGDMLTFRIRIPNTEHLGTSATVDGHDLGAR
jgi:hypothetical protein